MKIKLVENIDIYDIQYLNQIPWFDYHLYIDKHIKQEKTLIEDYWDESVSECADGIKIAKYYPGDEINPPEGGNVEEYGADYDIVDNQIFKDWYNAVLNDKELIKTEYLDGISIEEAQEFLREFRDEFYDDYSYELRPYTENEFYDKALDRYYEYREEY